MGTCTSRVPNQCHSCTAPPQKCADPCRNWIWKNSSCSRPSCSSCSQRTCDVYGVPINCITGRTGILAPIMMFIPIKLTVSKVDTFRDEFKLKAVAINSVHDGCSMENMKVKAKKKVLNEKRPTFSRISAVASGNLSLSHLK